MTKSFVILRDEPARLDEPTGFDSPKSAATGPITWADPDELPNGLKPVEPFDYEFLPREIAPWVRDITDRMQCPPDFVAVSAVTALGSALGRKLGIRPQQQTDWLEVPNFWACIVGRPGAMKSPAMEEALKPLKRLDAEARKANDSALKDFAAEQEAFELRKQDAQKKAKAALGRGDDISSMLCIDKPEAPKLRRFLVNDCTYEALGEILADNPTGVLAYRDELVSLLKTLDREEYAAARGFFLTAWKGTSGYTFDRIIRGRTHIEAVCVSLLGSTQPGKIAEYMRRAVAGGAGDDGLIQRFGLLVWPDQSPEWKNIDRYPDSEARQLAWDTFKRLSDLDPVSAGAEVDQFEPIPFLRFDAGAQTIFTQWQGDLEVRLRSGDLHPAIESHLSKYRKLVPALALINQLADNEAGPVDAQSLKRAIEFSKYLERHAQRAYAAGSEAEAAAAKAILKHIRKRDLIDGFSARDISQKGWSNLTDRNQVHAGLGLLEECAYVRRNCKNHWTAQDNLSDQSEGHAMTKYHDVRQKHVPQEPSKPPKAPFEGFEGDRAEAFFQNSSAARRSFALFFFREISEPLPAGGLCLGDAEISESSMFQLSPSFFALIRAGKAFG